MEHLFTSESIISFIVLVVLEVVLGIDNVIFVSIILNRLKSIKDQKRARRLWMITGILSRSLLLMGLGWLLTQKGKAVFTIAGKGFDLASLVMLAGGLFLIYKSVHEIHQKLEGEDPNQTNKNAKGISQAAISINSHYGFQSNNDSNDVVKASENFMYGTSIANRIWFKQNKLALTLRGDYLTNQSVVNGVNTAPYLAFSPAITSTTPNAFETAIANNEKLKLFQFTTTFDIMPNDFVTFRLEYGYRNSSIPYFTTSSGTTSPSGYINGPTGSLPWAANLQKNEHRLTLAVNFRL